MNQFQYQSISPEVQRGHDVETRRLKFEVQLKYAKIPSVLALRPTVVQSFSEPRKLDWRLENDQHL